MTNKAIVGCMMVGEFVDEGECPPEGTYHRGEVVRTQVVADNVEFWGNDEVLREFTVVMKDGRVIVVRGQSLKHSPHPVPEQNFYSIVIGTAAAEVLVGEFKVADVSGIFHGDRRIA